MRGYCTRYCGSSHTDLAGFFTRLEGIEIGPNLVSLIGHNAVRRAEFRYLRTWHRRIVSRVTGTGEELEIA